MDNKKNLDISKDGEINTDYTQVGHQSVFTMDLVNEIMLMKDTKQAIAHVISIIDASPARPATKTKAKTAVMKAKNISSLAQTMSNFILAHQGLNSLGKK